MNRFGLLILCPLLMSLLGCTSGSSKSTGTRANVTLKTPGMKVTRPFVCFENALEDQFAETPVGAKGELINTNEYRPVSVQFVVTSGDITLMDFIPNLATGPKFTNFYFTQSVPRGLTACSITIADVGETPPSEWKPCTGRLSPTPSLGTYGLPIRTRNECFQRS